MAHVFTSGSWEATQLCPFVQSPPKTYIYGELCTNIHRIVNKGLLRQFLSSTSSDLTYNVSDVLLRAVLLHGRLQAYRSTKMLDSASEDRSDSSLHLSCLWCWSAPRELSACTNYVVGGGFQRSHTICWQTLFHSLLHPGGSQNWMCRQTLRSLNHRTFVIPPHHLHSAPSLLHGLQHSWRCFESGVDILPSSNDRVAPAKNSKQGPNPGACAHKPQAVKLFFGKPKNRRA